MMASSALSEGRGFWPEHIILVADVLDGAEDSKAPDARRDLEQTDPDTLRSLMEAISSLDLPVTHVRSPDELAKLPSPARDAVVLTIYGGRASRSRMALVPAVCESLGLRFIGPDAYGRIVAQDKEVSKRLARDAGLLTPAWRLLRDRDDLMRPSSFRPPLVVKPLLEGSSIGISARNLVHDPADIARVAADLFTTFEQPVLVEAFVAGREVAYSRIENAGSDAWAFSEIVVDGEPGFFDDRLFDAEEKLVHRPGRSVANIDGELHPDDQIALERFLRLYGAYGYCRVDGRLADGRFHFLELTPDAWISPLGQFAMGFTQKGWTYAQVIEAVLASGPPGPPGRSPNG